MAGTYAFVSELGRFIAARSTAEAETRSLFTVLAARGFDISPAVRQQLDRSIDPDNIQPWISRAVTASTLQELFDWQEEEPPA